MPEQPVPVDRPLTSHEFRVLGWLLRNGKPQATSFIGQLDDLRVVSECSCGCASIDFGSKQGVAMEVLSDFQWWDSEGHLFGIFAFARGPRLAGLEVWSIDGAATPSVLPEVAALVPLESEG